jgi:hypothetical protein
MAKESTAKKAKKHKTARAKTATARAKNTTTTLAEALRQLESLGDEGMRAYNSKGGAGDNQFGVSLGDIRELAKRSGRTMR